MAKSKIISKKIKYINKSKIFKMEKIKNVKKCIKSRKINIRCLKDVIKIK
jgi:hypothetical protein